MLKKSNNKHVLNTTLPSGIYLVKVSGLDSKPVRLVVN
ncbi:hypothetical protein Fluta_2446 [Fluviicola taffensis DSM 16823]|uniref:Secretion system C-terminal sorting domain-containing protein n=1 Tax=Fluviicola taffensis (strain DSM 16823 / NCIMB 13979 / RW262) TaxID=755732 RepID=F2ID37_FLUTR|nr:hypothetical protein Fluta_2446 [Fluviicola taffensis DSM 16823]